MRLLTFAVCFSFCLLGSFNEPRAFAGDFVCEITETDLDADLDSAGPNSRCGADPKGPWACYCELTEVCQDRDNGQTLTFSRRLFLGCGDLGDCSFASQYGRQCSSMED
jgi:hypothetical protein